MSPTDTQPARNAPAPAKTKAMAATTPNRRTVFEIESKDFKDSIGGGGRYDNLIGKFTGEPVPAVGFSIGFEKIYCILSERGFAIPNAGKKIAIIYDDFFEAYKQAETLRPEFSAALFRRPSKLGKFLTKLQGNGCSGYYICGQSEGVKWF